MAIRTHLATLPGSGPHQRLLVALGQSRDGRLTIDLCDQHYAEGIGWFDQRTMSLEPSQFKQLQGVLGLKSSLLTEYEEPPMTLPFPGPREASPQRAAVGDGI
ncbi:hypothetical protein ACYOEI_24250 [Singulisphaera rosea]